MSEEQKQLEGLKAAVMERLCLDLKHSWTKTYCNDCDKRPPSVEYAVKLYQDAISSPSAEIARAEEEVVEAAKFLLDEIGRIAPRIIRSPGCKRLDFALSRLAALRKENKP